VLCVVNLDPFTPQEGVTWLDLWQLGLEHAGPFEAHDLLTDTTYIWHGRTTTCGSTRTSSPPTSCAARAVAGEAAPPRPPLKATKH
jgi:hypothetical protein